jgi:hypothetical protein
MKLSENAKIAYAANADEILQRFEDYVKTHNIEIPETAELEVCLDGIMVTIDDTGTLSMGITPWAGMSEVEYHSGVIDITAALQQSA